MVDKPSVSQAEQEKYPEYYGQNICQCLFSYLDFEGPINMRTGPHRDEKGIEGFEEAFKDLGR